MGHSSVLAEIGGRRVLFDPVWGERCSPFAFVGPRRVHPAPVPLESLTGLDVVVISHDHYDHLDMPDDHRAGPQRRRSSRCRWASAPTWSAGACPPERLRELDWNESTEVAGLTLTATPARHFCGRGLRNRQHTLWASWAVTDGTAPDLPQRRHRLLPRLRRHRRRHGPFDATMIQIGAYSEFWPENHSN